jgi:glycosyltransferase involved in cell wall biosynthesis
VAVPQRLSIITPSFNQAGFIDRTIRSVLDQGWPDLEYVVVDGGSTDGSVEIIKRYEDRLAWWVSEPDGGQTDALNKALRRVTGNVVAYINSDDYYLPGAFGKAMALMAQSDALWMAGAAQFAGPGGERIATWRAQPPQGRRHVWVRAPWGVPQAATFWRREAFERYGLFREDMHYVFDTEFGLRLALDGHLPATLHDELSVRVIHEEAKSWDRTPFFEEQRRFYGLFRDQLTPRERALYHVLGAAERAGVMKALGRGSRVWRRMGLPGLRPDPPEWRETGS